MPSVLTIAHRQAQLAIRADVTKRLTHLWPAMDWTNLDATFPVWADSVGTLVTASRATSSNVAAAYYRRLRASQGVPGVPQIFRAPPLEQDRLDTVLRITSMVAVKAAAARGVLAEPAMANAFVTSTGAATRLVLEGGRETLLATGNRDRYSSGYIRVTSGNACTFCEELAAFSDSNTYGGTTNEALYGDFQVHDHCGCTVEPVFD